MSELDKIFEAFRKWYEEKYHVHATRDSEAWQAYLLQEYRIMALERELGASNE